METQTHPDILVDGEKTLSGFFVRIYSWMIAGLLVSAFFSYLTLETELGINILSSQGILWGLTAIHIALLLGIQLAINKLPVELSRGLFFVYAAISGITLSGLFLAYTATSILAIFLIAAGMFAILAIWGATTKKDLSGWGTFLFVGMIGVFISSIVNIFLQNSFMNIIVSAVAILVFAGLTAYDNQAYKALYHQNKENADQLKKYATLGALHMYVNFIMIFVNLLQFFGSPRD